MICDKQMKSNNAINSDTKSYAALRFLCPVMAGVSAVKFYAVQAVVTNTDTKDDTSMTYEYAS